MRRIGLTQRVEVVAAYGERRDCLDQRWSGLLAEVGWLAVPLPNRADLAEHLLAELELAGLVLTGGNDLSVLPGAVNTAPERDAMEQRLIELSRQRGLPLLGVCRGAQMLAFHYGSRLERVEGHAGGRHPLRKLAELPLPSEVNSFHGFGLPPRGLDPGLVPLALAPDGSVEAFRHQALNQVGVMWHPEREQPLPAEDRDLLRRVFEQGGRP